jgi:hypothetical protein
LLIDEQDYPIFGNRGRDLFPPEKIEVFREGVKPSPTKEL